MAEALAQFKPLGRNPNKHTVRGLKALEDSIRQDGYTEPMVAAADGTVLSGNARLETVATLLDTEPIIVESDGTRPVIHVRRDIPDADSEIGRRVVVRANRVAELDLAWDPETLIGATPAEVIEALWSPEELSELGQEWGKQQPDDPGAQMDKAEELRQKWGVESGQLWQLGEHRLICGDCTDAAHVAGVMGGERAALLITSPPYGVGKEYETGDLEDWRTTIRGMLQSANVDAAFINLADIKCTPDKRERHTYGELILFCEQLGLPLIATRIWAKSPAWAQGPYWLSSYRPVDDFEYLGLFGMLEHRNRTETEWRYRGVWEFPSVASNTIHSASFPVELPERAITLLTDNGAIIYDPFLGSGTTLIACERLGRKCRAVEISPAYCAVALERWATMTGKTPVLIPITQESSKNGEP